MFPDNEPLLTFTYQLRSRYSETDKMGYVYYGRYLEYFEVARTEMIRQAGFSYRDLEESGIMLPVIHSEIQYKQPVFYDELMDIRVLLFDTPSVRLNTYYEIRTDEGRKLHTVGRVTLVFTSTDTRRPVRAPESFLNGILRLT